MKVYIVKSYYSQGMGGINYTSIKCVKRNKESAEHFIEKYEKSISFIKEKSPQNPFSSDFTKFRIESEMTDEEYNKHIDLYNEYEERFPDIYYSESEILEFDLE